MLSERANGYGKRHLPQDAQMVSEPMTTNVCLPETDL